MKVIQIHKAEDLHTRMKFAWTVVNQMILKGPIVVEIKRFCKTRLQERKYHSMIRDFAQQITFDGNKKYSVDVWKARLIEQFARDKELMGEPLSHPGTCVISLDGKRMITVRPSSTQFNIKEAAEFIEYLYATGCDMGVRFTEKNLTIYEQRYAA